MNFNKIELGMTPKGAILVQLGPQELSVEDAETIALGLLSIVAERRSKRDGEGAARGWVVTLSSKVQDAWNAQRGIVAPASPLILPGGRA